MSNIRSLYNRKTADNHFNKPEYELFLKKLHDAVFDILRQVRGRGDKYLLDGEIVMTIEETSCGAEVHLHDPINGSNDQVSPVTLYATIDHGSNLPLPEIKEHIQKVEDESR